MEGGVGEVWPVQWLKKVLVLLRVLGVTCRKALRWSGVEWLWFAA